MGWAQQVGGAAVGATGTCALRLWEKLKSCLRESRPGLSASHHEPMPIQGGPCIPSWRAGQTGGRAGLSSHERRRRCGMKTLKHKNAGYHKWGFTQHQPMCRNVHTWSSQHMASSLATFPDPIPNIA